MDNAYALTPVDQIDPLYAIEFLTVAAEQRAASLALPAERREAMASQVQACRAALDAELAELRAIRDRARELDKFSDPITPGTVRHILTGE